MPLVKVTPEDVTIAGTRILIVGSTGFGKTVSALTAPKPIHIVSVPGENGWRTIPLNDPGIIPYIWKQDIKADDDGNLIPGMPAVQIMNEVKREVVRIIAGKYGPIHTLVIDGIHKYMTLALDVASNGAFSKGDPMADSAIGPMYGQGQKSLIDFMKWIIQSQVPVAIFTTWDANEKERKMKPGESKEAYKNVSESLFPDLPGRLAKNIMGELSATVAMEIRAATPGAPPQRWWRIKPNSEIGGAQVKVPAEYAVTLPELIPAQYDVLAQVLACTYVPPVVVKPATSTVKPVPPAPPSGIKK